MAGALEVAVVGLSVARIARELVDVVLPRYCAGCAAPGVSWCAECAAYVAGQSVHRAVSSADYLLVARAPYRQQWASAIVAAKSQGRADLTPILAAYLAEAVAALPGEFQHDAVFVPVPSVAANTLRRGRLVTAELAQATAGLAGGVLAPALRVQGRSIDQSGLSVRQRQVNVRGRYFAEPMLVAGKRVIVVDDIVTSGATAFACAQAIAAAGATQIAVAALALTPR